MQDLKRIIARIDVKGGRLIKGVRFEGLRVLGDPREAAIKYYKSGADEIFYSDAVASLYGRNSLTELVKATAKEVFIPITVGGGIRSVNDVEKILASGADKIAINTASVENKSLIRELANVFGAQCIVASIQARKTSNKSWEVMTNSGRERSGIDVKDWVKEVQDQGAGEIIVTSIDMDGTCSGFDQELLAEVKTLVSIPLIFGGGIAKTKDIKSLINEKAISGISIGAALHYNKTNLQDLKSELQLNSTNLKALNGNEEGIDDRKYTLNDISIGIIDYGMGNQQSLRNALDLLGAKTFISDQTRLLAEADILALPGVGSFPEGMKRLRDSGLDKFIKSMHRERKPIFGICLGMQMLFESSEEYGVHEGLGLIPGKVECLNKHSKKEIKMPHVGWNQLQKKKEESKDIESHQYFVHSYAVMDLDEEHIIYNCTYEDVNFIAAVNKEKVLGFQFHPERSGYEGLKLLGSQINKVIGA